MRRCWFVIGLLVLAIGVWAGAPAAMAESELCANADGYAATACRLYCDALSCGDDEDDAQCRRLAEGYSRATGQAPPCGPCRDLGGDGLLCDFGLAVGEAMTRLDNINDALRLDDVQTDFDPTPAPDAPAGVFTITATFTNVSMGDLTSLFFEVAELTNNNVVLNAAGGPGGVGALVAGPFGPIAPNASFMVDFEIGLQTADPFRFFVDALDAPDFSVFANGGRLRLAQADIRGGLVGTANQQNIETSNGTPTVTDGVRSDGNFTGMRGFSTDGDVIANGNVVFTDTCDVDGDVTAGGTVTLNNCVPGGTVTPNVTPDPYTPPMLPAPICDFSGVDTADDPPVDGGGDVTLAPGVYDDLDLNLANYTFVSGVYVFDTFGSGAADQMLTINLSNPATDGSGLGNEIIICVRRRIDLSATDTEVVLRGRTPASVYWETAGSGNSGIAGPSFPGTLYASNPNGNARFANTDSISGSVYAGGQASFGANTVLNYVPTTVTGAPAFP